MNIDPETSRKLFISQLTNLIICHKYGVTEERADFDRLTGSPITDFDSTTCNELFYPLEKLVDKF